MTAWVSAAAWVKKYRWQVSVVLLCLLVYCPFLGGRVIRMAGDEKVYVAQALEMRDAGTWFLQRLAGEPNYYKGPLHYLLLRLGMVLFGNHPFALLYMNFFLVTAGALSVGAFAGRRLARLQGVEIFSASIFCLGIGIYTHAFVSQMELELAACFAIALNLLDRASLSRSTLSFWILTGLVGWLKSPLHSAFLGMTALLFWATQGELVSRLRSRKDWLAVGAGVLVGFAGYLPAAILDWANFYRTYLERETFGKVSGSGEPWWISIRSSFGFYLFPWVFVALVSYLKIFQDGILQLSRLLSGKKPRKESLFSGDSLRVILLSVCCVFPSVVFFIYHPYRFENYNLPVFAAVVLGLTAGVAHFSGTWKLLLRVSLCFTAIFLLAIPVGVTVLARHFETLPDWWPKWLVSAIWLGTGISVAILLRQAFRKQGPALDQVGLGFAGLYLALGCLILTIGEREMVDFRKLLTEEPALSSRPMGYLNLRKNIWNEWGMLRFWVPREIYHAYSKEIVRESLLHGHALVVPAGEQWTEFETWFAQDPEMAGKKLARRPWARWSTQGRSISGKPLWQEAWTQKTFTPLERQFQVVWLEDRTFRD